MRRLHVRILCFQLVKDALPKRVAVRHGVALVGHAHTAQAARPRELEGVADDAVDALVGVDLFLYRDFVRSAGLEAAAHAHIDPFGVLAEHDEVHVAARPVLQRAQPVVQQLDGPIVDVQIQLEAGAKEDVAGMAVIRHPRVPQRAHQNRVNRSERVVAAWRNRHAGLQIVVGAPRQFLEFEAANGAEHLDRLRGHLAADAVAGDHGNPLRHP